VTGTATATGAGTVVELVGMSKRYRRGSETVHALEAASIRVGSGELVALVGPSGSGKTTLLNLVCGWETPDAGALRWGPMVEGRAERWSDLAIVPQALGLVEELTVRENAALPLRFPAVREPADVDQVLERLGLTELAHRPSTGTSLGEQQRTAIARALVARPRLLVADEPTAHQNAAWARTVLGELRSVCTDGGAVLVATHDRELLGAMDRVITLHDGRVVNRRRRP
jgi:putative ABC transport system ATP-binding protein